MYILTTIFSLFMAATAVLALSGQATTTVRNTSIIPQGVILSNVDGEVFDLKNFGRYLIDSHVQLYWDGHRGACGCGSSGGKMYPWQSEGESFHTAAGSPLLFDSVGGGNSTFCGSGCGACFKLTSTGAAPGDQGSGGAKGESLMVMITNLCPTAGNAQWCPPSNEPNAYGYQYHFDLMASDSTLQKVLGNNPVVDFEAVDCPSAAANNYDQCDCH